jgi:hypothetical protein
LIYLIGKRSRGLRGGGTRRASIINDGDAVTRKDKIQQQINQLHEKYHKQIKTLLIKNIELFASELIQAAPDQDMHGGFDYIYSFNDLNIPCRIRQYKYRWYCDVTIRSRIDWCPRTELDKIKELYSNLSYYFYCWENPTRTEIYSYVIYDIKRLVTTGLIDMPNETNIPNGDGTYFNAYTLRQLKDFNVLKTYETINVDINNGKQKKIHRFRWLNPNA